MTKTHSLLVAGVLALAGCGGSSGGGGGTVLTGNFKAAQLGGFIDTGSPRFTTVTATASADSAGTLAIVSTVNDQGTVAAGGASKPTSLGSDRSFAILTGTTPDSVGWFDPSLDVGIVASVLAGQNPFFATLTREWPGTATNASFSGSYHLGGMGNGGTVTTLVAAASSDGAGNLAVAAGGIFNAEGSISAAGADSLPYSVAADGTTTLGAVGDPQFSGGLAPGGAFLVASGATSAGDEPRLLVFVQAATTATNATLFGTYRIVGLGYDFGTPPAVRSVTGTFTADGTGGATAQFTTNEEGVITTDPSSSAATYAVSANGVVALATSGGTLQGAVSPDGNRGFVAGGTNAGSEPILLLFVRQ